MAVVSTVAPKVTSTCSEGAKPRQDRVTRAPAGPLVGDRAQLALVGLATVVVVVLAVPAVVRVAAVVGWVVLRGESRIAQRIEEQRELIALWGTEVNGIVEEVKDA